MRYVNRYSDMRFVTATAPDPLRTARHENRRFGRRTTGGSACTHKKWKGLLSFPFSYCILYLRPRKTKNVHGRAASMHVSGHAGVPAAQLCWPWAG